MADPAQFWKDMMENLWGQPAGKQAAALAQKVPELEQKEKEDRQRQGRVERARTRAPAVHQMGAAGVWGDGAHPFSAHAQAQSDMYSTVNSALSNEMSQRRRQAEAERDRQHEIQLAAMQMQARQSQPQPQPVYQPPVELDDEARKARNRQLMGMAGVHGQSIRTDGRGGVSVHHHSYADSPFGRALLG